MHGLGMATKAAIYIRVSRRDQNFENQVPALLKIAESRGYEIVNQYSDKMSGAKRSRPGFDQMLEDARRGKFEVLLVWAIDRIGRSMYGVINTFLELEKSGITVISHQEPWTDTQVKDLLVCIFAWLAQQERQRIIERTDEGIAYARSQGKHLGRPPASVDIDEVLKLRKAGVSFVKIGKKLGVHAATINRHIQASADVPDALKKQKPRVRVRKTA